MLRRLLTPRWLGALLLATLFAAASYYLGHWQYGRHLDKVQRNERISAHYGAPAVPVESVLSSTPMAIDLEWTHVAARGTFGPQKLVVRGRTFDGDVGYEVLAPLLLDTGAVVLIDRGWIPLGDKGAAEVPAFAPPPDGSVTVTGWLRRGEASRNRTTTPGQLASLNLAEASSALGVPLLGGYVQFEGQDRPAPQSALAAVQPLGKPDRSLGSHQAYAYQWWLTVPLGFVLIGVGVRREAREAAEPRTQVAASVPARKTRIWDEEDA